MQNAGIRASSGGSGGNGIQAFVGSALLKTYDRSSFTKSVTIVVGGSGIANTVNVTQSGNE